MRVGLAISFLLEYLHITRGKGAGVEAGGLILPYVLLLTAAALIIIGGLILRYTMLAAG